MELLKPAALLLLAGCTVNTAKPGVDLFPCSADTDCTPYACGPQGFCLLGDAGLVPWLCLGDAGGGEYAPCSASSDCRCPAFCGAPAAGSPSLCLLSCSASPDCPASQLCEVDADGGPFCGDGG